MKVQIHAPVALAHGREETVSIETSAPHVYFLEDGGAELRWSASDSASHTHNVIVRVRVGAKEAEALRALVRRRTRAAFGQAEHEPPPPRQEEHALHVDPSMPEWAPPEEPRPDGKPWTPPGTEPHPIAEEQDEEHEPA